MNKLVILGAGGYANTVKDVAEQLGYEIVAMLDDKLPGFELDTYTRYIADNVEFAVAFGNNEFRLSWITKLTSSGAQLATLIHPSAYVSPKASVAPGTVVMPGSVVNTGCHLHTGCIVNIGSLVDHDCVLMDGVHLAPGCVVKGENRIPRGCKIESGVVVERGQFPL